MAISFFAVFIGLGWKEKMKTKNIEDSRSPRKR